MIVYEVKLNYRDTGKKIPSEAINEPEKIVAAMQGAFDEDPTVEWFYVLLLNRKLRPIGRVMVTKGTASAALVHPREVFKAAIVAGASCICAVHNHPSGDPSPSSADLQVTSQLREAGKVLGIGLVDHLIIGHKEVDPQGLGYYSFQEAGLV